MGTKQLQDVLTASADAAAATGRSFDTIAQGLDRIAATGMVSTRQMVQFGVSMSDIAAQMGVSVDEAIKLLKKGGQDAQKDVEAVVGAIEEKFGGAAELIAQNLSGQFTNLKNELAFISEDLGTALAPLASDLIAGLKGIEPTLRGIADGVVVAVAGLKNMAAAIGNLMPDFLKMIVSAPNMIALGTAIGFIGATLGALYTTAHAALLVMGDLAAKFQQAQNRYRRYNQGHAPGLGD